MSVRLVAKRVSSSMNNRVIRLVTALAAGAIVAFPSPVPAKPARQSPTGSNTRQAKHCREGRRLVRHERQVKRRGRIVKQVWFTCEPYASINQPD